MRNSPTWQKLKDNPQLFDRYFVKEYVIKAARKFFEEQNYHELESPILTDALPQERYLDVLTTQISQKNSRSKTAYLLPSTETFNKKMLAAGLGAHFVITKVFRGLEEISSSHSPEFTMLEWYHLQANYFDLMKDAEAMIIKIKRFLEKKLKQKKSNFFMYQGQKIDFNLPWPRISITAALKKYARLELAEIQSLKEIKNAAKAKRYQIAKEDDWQSIFELIFANEVEPNLPQDQPYFLYDYPRIMCPLTKVKDSNPLVCEKTELYIAGMEIANGYTELRDAEEQEKRFLEEQKARKKLGKQPIKFDSDLVAALKLGLPEVAGMGMGLDRLAMIFAGAKNISEINYFPSSEMFAGEDNQ